MALPSRASTNSNRLPSSCSAMSLNASVGPLDTRSRWNPDANVVSGVVVAGYREIGVMKTLGANTPQLVRMYLLLIAVIGLAALVVALPLGVIGTRVFAESVARLLNLTLTQTQAPWWALALQAARHDADIHHAAFRQIQRDIDIHPGRYRHGRGSVSAPRKKLRRRR